MNKNNEIEHCILKEETILSYNINKNVAILRSSSVKKLKKASIN